MHVNCTAQKADQLASDQDLVLAEIIKANLGQSDHCKAILYLLNAYACDPMGGNAPISESVLNEILPGLRSHPTSQVFLAKSGDKFVGVAVCFTGFSTFAAKPLINIHDLAVLTDYRGKGIGRALLQAIEQMARDTNCCKVTLEVREDNPKAAALYFSEGYSGAELEEQTVQYLFLEKRL